MKKVYIVLCVVTILIAFIIGLSMQNRSVKDELINNETDITENKTEQIFDKDIVEIPISDVEMIAKQSENGITSMEAEQLCQEILGDSAEENGFPISYRCISAVSVNDKLYYVMHISWLVNNSHWSYIGNCFVSYDGKEIYDGLFLQEEYSMTELRWRQ